jgi:hypothetical protein
MSCMTCKEQVLCFVAVVSSGLIMPALQDAHPEGQHAERNAGAVRC